MYKEKRNPLTKSGEEPEKEKRRRAPGKIIRVAMTLLAMTLLAMIWTKRKNDEKRKAGGRIGLKDQHRAEHKPTNGASRYDIRLSFHPG